MMFISLHEDAIAAIDDVELFIRPWRANRPLYSLRKLGL